MFVAYRHITRHWWRVFTAERSGCC